MLLHAAVIAVKTNARNVVGRGEKSLLSNPTGSELRLGGEKEKEKGR